jgi:hypothetical protein
MEYLNISKDIINIIKKYIPRTIFILNDITKLVINNKWRSNILIFTSKEKIENFIKNNYKYKSLDDITWKEIDKDGYYYNGINSYQITARYGSCIYYYIIHEHLVNNI